MRCVRFGNHFTQMGDNFPKMCYLIVHILNIFYLVNMRVNDVYI